MDFPVLGLRKSDPNCRRRGLFHFCKTAKSRLKNTIILTSFIFSPVFLTISLVFLSKHDTGDFFIRGSAFELFAFSVILCNVLLFCYIWKKNPDLFRNHLVFIIVFLLISMSYLGFLREYHPKSWDFMSYYLAGKGIEASINIYDHQIVTEFNKSHNHQKTTYLYTPLLATIMSLLTKIGDNRVFILYEFGNFYALALLLILLYSILLRYGILSKHLISILMFLIFIINVPVMRTFIHGQINFHTMNFILLSILFLGKNDLISASFLCLAGNLKLSPVLLVGAFILRRNWKWLYYFCFLQMLIIVFTSIICGYEYWFWFLEFLFKMDPSSAFRNNSLDSLFSNMVGVRGVIFGNSVQIRKVMIVCAKIGVLSWIVRVLVLTMRERVFFRSSDDIDVVYNVLPILLICMVVLSPYMWPHHFVFLILPCILLISCCRYKGKLVVYLAGYFSMFIIPVFDIFPFSYHRILGVFLMIFVLHKSILDKSYGVADFVVEAGRKLDRMVYGATKSNEQFG